MSKEDTINIEILENGLVRSTTDVISPANHSNASDFFRFLDDVTGTKAKKSKRSKKHVHHTHEDHQHEGGGHGHSH